MGIKQLFKSLEIYIEDAHLSSFRGFRVGVDTNAWIHRGARQCAEELADKQKTNRYVTYVLSKVKMLQAYGLIPTMVFDGKPLPAKRETSRARGELRKKKLDEAKQYRSSGNSTEARKSFKKAVTVTPMMVYNIVKELQGLCINYVVAPHEADAQLAFLCKNGLVDAVISDDADMVPFGCHRIFRGLDWLGNFRELNCENFSRFAEFSETKGTCDSIDLSGFDHQMIIIMCVMYGCDYLKGQFSLTRAHSLVKNYKCCYHDLIEASKKEGIELPEGYCEELKRAVNIFKHQVVYDTEKQCTVHLSKCTADGADLSYLGILLPSDMGKEIEVGPRAMLNYKDGFISKEVAPTSSSEREHKPLGKGLGGTLEFLRDRGPTGEERFLNESSSNRRNMGIEVAPTSSSEREHKPLGKGLGGTLEFLRDRGPTEYYLDRVKTEEGSSIKQNEHEKMGQRKKPKTRLVLDPP